MNARVNYFILFGFCLAVFSSSSLAVPVGAVVPDPLGRIAAMGNSMVTSVRSPVPYHFSNLAPSVTRVVSNVDVWGGLFRLRYTGMGLNMSVPAVVTYSRAAAVGALRGCISTGPYCFAGAAVGVATGIGISSFLSSSGYDVTDSGTIVSNSTVDTFAPVAGSCFAQGSSIPVPCLGSNSVIGANSSYSSITSYLDSFYTPNEKYTIVHVAGNCTSPGYKEIVCTDTGWNLIENGSGSGKYYYGITYTSFSFITDWNSPYPQSGAKRYFGTSLIPSFGSPVSSVVNELQAGATVDASVLLDSLDFDLYEPDSTDFAILGNRLVGVAPVSIDFDEFPITYTSPIEEIVYDEFGDAITTTTVTTFTPSAVNNGTAAPSIEIATNTNTVVKDSSGVISDTNTGTIVRPDDVVLNPDTGLPYPPPPNADTAYDCWSFQFICDWFAWTQLMPDLDEPDFNEIKGESQIEYVQRTVNSGAPATCPTGIDLDLGYFGDYSVSYDSFCDLAVTAKPLFLTFMSILSLFIVYRSFSS